MEFKIDNANELRCWLIKISNCFVKFGEINIFTNDLTSFSLFLFAWYTEILNCWFFREINLEMCNFSMIEIGGAFASCVVASPDHLTSRYARHLLTFSITSLDISYRNLRAVWFWFYFLLKAKAEAHEIGILICQNGMDLCRWNFL